MTTTKIDEIDTIFFIEMQSMRKKYPHYYIEVWGPYDFATQLKENDCGIAEHDEINTYTAENWHHWSDVVEILSDCHDANVGTNWETIRQAVKEIERNAS
jgi:hypothetical protein